MFTNGKLFGSDGRMTAAAVALAIALAGGLAAQEIAPPKAKSTGGQAFLSPQVEGAPSNSFLGVNILEVNAEVARKLNLAEERGVVITGVVEDSAAEEAGVEKGDVVLEYNGQKVEGVNQFIRLVRETPAGRTVTIRISRDGSVQDLSATIGERKSRAAYSSAGSGFRFAIPNAPRPPIVIPDVPHIYTTWRSAKLGIVGESLESQLAEFFGVDEGVLVRSVTEDSPASRAGLKAGDVIISVGGMRVTTPREVSSALREREGSTVPVTLIRKQKQLTLEVTFESGGGNGRMLERMIPPEMGWRAPARSISIGAGL